MTDTLENSDVHVRLPLALNRQLQTLVDTQHQEVRAKPLPGHGPKTN